MAMVMTTSNTMILLVMVENLLGRKKNFSGRNMNVHHANIMMAPSNHKLCATKTSAINDDRKFVDITHKWRDTKTAAAVVLAGGAGSRLFPLTQRRAKPAVPIGGAYRLIDVPLSNCLNSGLRKIYIMTQFNSASLNKHITGTYNMSNSLALADGFVEVLAATQTPEEEGSKWFQGTADAVRQFDWLFKDEKAKDIQDILILSGDHLYRMDYMNFIESHRLIGADVTISCLPMDDSRASDFGLMKIDNTGRVVSFCEKPKGDDLKKMEVDTSVLGLSRKEAEQKPYIASMGIYVFKKNVLLNLLRTHFPKANDFGSEIIPASAKEFLVKAFLFNDYWEDLGTIRSFYEANLALTETEPRFNFYDEANPMYTCKRSLPPSMINSCKVVDTIISQGCILDHCSVEHSIIGVGSRISTNVCLKDTVMFGADIYETDAEREKMLAEEKVPVGIGENANIRKCIIDKNVRIGRNVVIANSEGVQEASQLGSEGLFIKDGIVIISKNSTIRDGFVL